MIQEPLALTVEADGQLCPPSLQLTEKLVSNLERKRALSNSKLKRWKSARCCLLVFWANNAHSSAALAFVLKEVIQECY